MMAEVSNYDLSAMWGSLRLHPRHRKRDRLLGAHRALEMLVDAVVRPATAVQQNTFSGLERDMDLSGILPAALQAGGYNAPAPTHLVYRAMPDPGP
jgi:hypothetical protein